MYTDSTCIFPYIIAEYPILLSIFLTYPWLPLFQVLLSEHPQHPFDLTVYGDFIFWTDWVSHAVMRADKYTGSNVVTLRKNIPRPMGIVAIANDTDCECEFEKFGYCDILFLNL